MKKRPIEQGRLYFLWNPGEGTFSGYGLTVEPNRKDHLVGLLMVDRPHPVNSEWLAKIELAFGNYELYAMTDGGERGIACQMWIQKRSLPYIRHMDTPRAKVIQAALAPLLKALLQPQFELY